MFNTWPVLVSVIVRRWGSINFTFPKWTCNRHRHWET